MACTQLDFEPSRAFSGHLLSWNGIVNKRSSFGLGTDVRAEEDPWPDISHSSCKSIRKSFPDLEMEKKRAQEWTLYQVTTQQVPLLPLTSWRCWMKSTSWFCHQACSIQVLLPLNRCFDIRIQTSRAGLVQKLAIDTTETRIINHFSTAGAVSLKHYQHQHHPG